MSEGQPTLAARLRAHVAALCALDPPRCWGSPGLDAAGARVLEALRAATGEARRQAYSASLGGTSGEVFNVIARLGDGPAPLRVLGAHYDAVAGTPGADDNASAVAVLIEVGRLLAAAPRLEGPPVELVAYTLEEPPAFGTAHMGSAVHAAGLRHSKVPVEGMISLEMVGYFDDRPGRQGLPPAVRALLSQPPERADFYALSGKAYARSWVRRVEAGLRRHLRTPLHAVVAPDLYRDIDLSDHVPYQEVGIPAAMLGDTAHYRNPHYHRSSDRPHTLDYERMADLAQALALWLAAPAGP